ncbi:DUF4234 domain-containing protein [Streptomyces sp. NPDC096030]|uniref:DUF4234 domain-containing protein n=1 Tax=Streptomyces sp. NPDC096030 TaxID=3155423 RepID=UPI00331E0914
MTGTTGKERNIFTVWLVWPLLTLGIYHFVWYYKINREARDFDERTESDPVMSLLAITLGLLIIVPAVISIYQTGVRIAQMQRSAGTTPTCNGWIGLALSLLALHALYYQYELNTIWDHYGSPEEGTRVALAQ